MNGEEIIKYCLEKRGAYLDFPFGEGYATVKIKTLPKRNGYVFAEIFELNGEERFTLTTVPATRAPQGWFVLFWSGIL